MNTALARRPSLGAAFGGLIDYAGLFPPAGLPMAQAAAQYETAQAGEYNWMLGRFVLSASRLPEASGQPLCVIVDAEPDPRRWFASAQRILAEIGRVRGGEPGCRIEALEVPLPPLASERETYDAPIGQLGGLLDRAGLRDLPVFVEWPRRPALLSGAMAACARARVGAKLRCGGVTAQAFPSVDEVATFLAAAAGAGVRFKATAGLHHPVRHSNAASGFTMHGFLNLLVAATFAGRVDNDTLARIVAEEDARTFVFEPEALVWRDCRADLTALRAMRAKAFVGYGSCSFDEPIADLQALAILPVAA